MDYFDGLILGLNAPDYDMRRRLLHYPGVEIAFGDLHEFLDCVGSAIVLEVGCHIKTDRICDR